MTNINSNKSYNTEDQDENESIDSDTSLNRVEEFDNMIGPNI